MSHKVAIIGSGPSGLTAAIYTSRANLDTTVYLGLQPGGQLTTTTEIENFPGFVNGIDGPELMENMQKQAERFGAETFLDEVTELKIANSKFTIKTKAGEKEFDSVIIASGARAKYIGLPGEEKFVGKGYHSCATCDGFFYRGKTIVVVGGGDSAMEEANFLTKFGTKVYIIHRREEFRASKIMLDRARANPKIEFITNKKVVEFLGSEKVTGIILEDTREGFEFDEETLKKENSDLKNLGNNKFELTVDGVFVAVGHIPNSTFVKGILSMDEAGYLIPKNKQLAKLILEKEANPSVEFSRYSTMSEIEGVFIAGDVEDTFYRQAITAAGDGCRAAMDCEKWLEAKAD